MLPNLGLDQTGPEVLTPIPPSRLSELAMQVTSGALSVSAEVALDWSDGPIFLALRSRLPWDNSAF